MDKPVIRYQLVGVTGSGGVIESRGGMTAPAEGRLISWGKERRCDFVMRYFPSRKGWRILDIRRVVSSEVKGGRFQIHKGQVRGQKYYETKDAAIMVALHMLNCPA